MCAPCPTEKRRKTKELFMKEREGLGREKLNKVTKQWLVEGRIPCKLYRGETGRPKNPPSRGPKRKAEKNIRSGTKPERDRRPPPETQPSKSGARGGRTNTGAKRSDETSTKLKSLKSNAKRGRRERTRRHAGARGRAGRKGKGGKKTPAGRQETRKKTCKDSVGNRHWWTAKRDLREGNSRRHVPGNRRGEGGVTDKKKRATRNSSAGQRLPSSGQRKSKRGSKKKKKNATRDQHFKHQKGVPERGNGKKVKKPLAGPRPAAAEKVPEKKSEAKTGICSITQGGMNSDAKGPAITPKRETMVIGTRGPLQSSHG